MLEMLQAEERKIKTVLANPKRRVMKLEDWRTDKTVTKYHVCKRPLGLDSVLGHCHITGKYRGTAHNARNLKLRLNPKTTTIPVSSKTCGLRLSPPDANHQ